MAAIRAGAAGAVAGVATLGGLAGADVKPTGQNCANYFFFDGQGVQRLGTRCARAEVTYNANDAHTWRITTYRIRYDVTPGLTWGPHSNEDPAEIVSGFRGGARQWLSPDDGTSNAWIGRNYPDSTTFKGNTRFKIRAVPDIPNQADPHLSIQTALW